MSIEECIDAYMSLSDKVFEKQRHRVTVKGKIQGRFDTAALERAVKQILVKQGLGEDELLKDSLDAACKVCVRGVVLGKVQADMYLASYAQRASRLEIQCA
jgi:hypothetical protein